MYKEYVTHYRMQEWLCWYRYVRHRDDSHTTRTVLDMVVEGVRPRRRPTLRYMDTIRRDTKKNGLTDVNFLDRQDWRLTESRATHWCGRAFKVRRIYTTHETRRVLFERCTQMGYEMMIMNLRGEFIKSCSHLSIDCSSVTVEVYHVTETSGLWEVQTFNYYEWWNRVTYMSALGSRKRSINHSIDLEMKPPPRFSLRKNGWSMSFRKYAACQILVAHMATS